MCKWNNDKTSEEGNFKEVNMTYIVILIYFLYKPYVNISHIYGNEVFASIEEQNWQTLCKVVLPSDISLIRIPSYTYINIISIMTFHRTRENRSITHGITPYISMEFSYEEKC